MLLRRRGDGGGAGGGDASPRLNVGLCEAPFTYTGSTRRVQGADPPPFGLVEAEHAREA